MKIVSAGCNQTQQKTDGICSLQCVVHDDHCDHLAFERQYNIASLNTLGQKSRHHFSEFVGGLETGFALLVQVDVELEAFRLWERLLLQSHENLSVMKHWEAMNQP